MADESSQKMTATRRLQNTLQAGEIATDVRVDYEYMYIKQSHLYPLETKLNYSQIKLVLAVKELKLLTVSAVCVCRCLSVCVCVQVCVPY